MEERPGTVASDTIYALMERKQWDRKDVAAATGLDYKTVLRWISGESKPPSRRVADALARAGEDPTTYGISSPRLAPAPVAAPMSSELGAIMDAIAELRALVEDIPALRSNTEALAGDMAVIRAYVDQQQEQHA